MVDLISFLGCCEFDDNEREPKTYFKDSRLFLTDHGKDKRYSNYMNSSNLLQLLGNNVTAFNQTSQAHGVIRGRK